MSYDHSFCRATISYLDLTSMRVDRCFLTRLELPKHCSIFLIKVVPFCVGRVFFHSKYILSFEKLSVVNVQ